MKLLRLTLVLAALAAPAQAQEPPRAADLLFEAPQFASAPAGTTLAYDYRRRAQDAEAFGPAFADRIILKVNAAEAGHPETERTVQVNFFTGERHRAAGPFEGVTGNPVMILFLENHIRDLSARLSGNARYFKNAIRAALRDRAEVRPATVPLDGSDVPGWQIRVRPFVGDPNAERMRGLEGITYTFTVSPQVPGAIAAIAVEAPGPAGTPLWEETLAYDPKG